MQQEHINEARGLLGANPQKQGAQQQPQQQLDPKQTAQAKQFIDKAKMIMHGEASDKFLSQIDPQNPAQGVGSGVVMIIGKLEQDLQANGIQMDEQAKVLGSIGVMTEFIELVEAFIKRPLTEDEIVESISIAGSLHYGAKAESGTLNLAGMDAATGSNVEQQYAQAKGVAA